MKFYTRLLEKLKDATIINYLGEINNVDSEKSLDLYDVMLEKLFNGDLDNEFESKYLDESNKEEVLELARKYKSLCFYKGDVTLWTDSIDGVTLLDPDLVCTKLLDNYDFLIRIARDGGEDTLKFLLNFSESEFALVSSVIDAMRNFYDSDDDFSNIMIDMSKENGSYKDFSTEQRVLLCSYPEGTLYDGLGDDRKMIPVEKLLSSLKKYIIGEDDSTSIKDILKEIPYDDFEDVIYNIIGDYRSKMYGDGNKTY